MNNASGIAQEKQIQFEKDTIAFNALTRQQQAAAASLGTLVFESRRRAFLVGSALMGALDGSFDFLFRAPFVAIKNLFGKRQDKPKKTKTVNNNSPWQKIKKVISTAAKKAGDFVEYYGAIGLYRATKWLLNPRTRAGKPFFGNEAVNKAAGLVGGILTFSAMSAGFAFIEVMAKIWHVQLARILLNRVVPAAVAVGQQAVFHTLLSWGTAGLQFLMVPAIAAARQTLKEVKFVQGISYQYNSKRRASQNGKQPEAAPAKWRPSSLVVKFIKGILEKTSPEFYKARLKHFRALHQEKAALYAPQPASDLGNRELNKPFNDNAPPKKESQDPSPRVAAPDKNPPQL
jgi:hypothetical protein